jgi:hypothetical protein
VTGPTTCPDCLAEQGQATRCERHADPHGICWRNEAQIRAEFREDLAKRQGAATGYERAGVALSRLLNGSGTRKTYRRAELEQLLNAGAEA